jgi:hypothetical protein
MFLFVLYDESFVGFKSQVLNGPECAGSGHFVVLRRPAGAHRDVCSVTLVITFRIGTQNTLHVAALSTLRRSGLKESSNATRRLAIPNLKPETRN